MISESFGPRPVLYKDRGGWLIALGVVEILIACFSLLLVILVLSLPHWAPRNSPAQASTSPGAMIFAAVLYGGMAAVLLAIGVGSIRCKNWARIAMLAVSGWWLGSGVLSTLCILLLAPGIMHQQGGISPQARHIVLVVMTATMGFFMVVMPTVFLVFYSRKSVRATCLSRGAGQVPGPTTMELPTSYVPVPVIILAIWEGLGVFAVLAFLVVRVTVVFGVVLHGPAAFLVLLVHSALGGYAAWLIYRRKLLGWAIALFKTVFWTASAVTTFAGHDVLQIYREMGLSEEQLHTYEQFPQVQTMIWLMTLPVMTALLVFILYTKKFFSQTGTGAASAGGATGTASGGYFTR